MAGADGLTRKERSKLQVQIDAIKESLKREPAKFSTFWGSTPIWTGIGVLIGAMASQLSLKLLFVAVWGIFVFEFVRVGFFKEKVAKLIGNMLAGIMLAVIFIGLWRLSPKPKEPTTVDQEMNAFAQRFPWLASKPEPSQPIVIAPPSVRPTKPPEPVVRIEPEEGTIPSDPNKKGAFMLKLENDGVDIDHLDVKQDFFITQTVDGKLRFNRLAQIVGGASNLNGSPLRTNQSIPIAVDFNSVISMIRGLRKSGYDGFIGVRVRAYFRRYSDQIDFHLAKGYVAFTGLDGGVEFLSTPDEKNRVKGMFNGDIRKWRSYMNTDDSWVDPIFDQAVGSAKVQIAQPTLMQH
jgi:hypothetical protein